MRCRHSILLAAILLLAMLTTPSTAFADEARDGQWYLDTLGIEKAHELSQGEGVTIGLVDSGVDATHPDLEGSVKAGASFSEAAGDGLTDDRDHGTGIASILVGRGHGENNSDGVLGIAPKAKVKPYDACEEKCDRTTDAISEGIKWLTDHDVDIISISMAADPSATDDAVEYATSKGIAVVASAGNVKKQVDDLGEVDIKGTGWPAVSKGVIPVSGTNHDGEFWDGSQDLVGAAVQPQLGLSAPATELPAASVDGGYATHSGTSGSAPIVAGTLALIKSAYPDLSYEQVNERLLLTADDQGPKGFDDKYGWGIVNPHRALTDDVKHFKGGISTEEDRVPLSQQGLGQGSSKNDNGDGTDEADGVLTATSSPMVLILVIIAVVVVAAAAMTTIIVVTKRRKAKLSIPNGSLVERHSSCAAA